MQDLLFLAHRIPCPPNKGDKIRSYHLLRHLAGRYRVHLGAFVDTPDDWRHVEAVRRLCGETFFAPLRPLTARLRGLSGLAAGRPLTLACYRDAAMQDWVDSLLWRLPVARILVFSAAMAQYVMHARAAARVVDFVDVDSDKWRQYARTRPWPLSLLYRREADALLRAERGIAAEFDASLFVSKAEAGLFRQLAPEAAERVGFINNGVDVEYFSPSRGYPNPYGRHTRALVFTGAMDYWPNVDAVTWFAREVLPAVRRASAAVRFYIVGARPVRAVRRLAQLPGVVVTGAVEDVRPYLAHGHLAVAPLRVARGVQNKVLEAMAMEKTVVCSPQSAQGIGALPGREFFIAEGARAFAGRIVDLLSSPLRETVGVAARRRILSDYRWEKNLSRLTDCFDLAAKPFLLYGGLAPERPGAPRFAEERR
jgi:sugar transferase (PEP-CTERM/EpsH1 system associated)